MLLNVFVNELPARVIPKKRFDKLGIAAGLTCRRVHKRTRA